MGLVTSKEIIKALGFNHFGSLGTVLGAGLLRLLRISKVNKIYDKYKGSEGVDFLNSILDEFDVKFEIPEEDLKRIPVDGPFITISNHPLGGIDGILLLKLLLEHRSDYKIIANFLLQRIKPLEPYILPVNPFENNKNIKSSLPGLKNALFHLKNGNPLGIFPAGEVSTLNDGEIKVDKPWEESAIKLIQRAGVTVIPVYFHAKNSKLFYFLSKINGTLRTAKLPSELLSQKNRVIKVRIGKPITFKEQKQYTDVTSFHDFLRKKTYLLANPFSEKSKILLNGNIKFPRKVNLIAKRKNIAFFIKEIDELRDDGKRLFKSKNYEVFFASPKNIPNILEEIGRLREVTFRAIGEGSNKSIDLDKYDNYYHHLILWDFERDKLVGAYRMGLGKDIYENYGISGFYIQTLFRIESQLHLKMKDTIELGRAFIIEDYQQKPMPLFLLWKGILHVTLSHPEYKYLVGGVSISNKFSDFSKALMIEFMKSNYYDHHIAQFIHPKKEYKVKLKDTYKDFVFDVTQSDMQKLDKIIDELEPGALRVPVLLKKYVKQNARLVAFNVDPKFNDAIDGLMYIKISDIPESTIKPVMEEFLSGLDK